MNRNSFDKAKKIDERISLIDRVLKKIYTDKYDENKYFEFYMVFRNEGLLNKLEQILKDTRWNLVKKFENID